MTKRLDSLMKFLGKGEKLAEYPEIKKWIELYYMNGVRDLLFHAQEHQFTPLQIKDLCETHNLTFLGFTSLKPKTVAAYRELFPEDTEMTSLANWDRFEQAHPQTFVSMLNFSDTSRSKHHDRRTHYMRHLCHRNVLDYKYVPGTENRADALTKRLSTPIFRKHVADLLGRRPLKRS